MLGVNYIITLNLLLKLLVKKQTSSDWSYHWIRLDTSRSFLYVLPYHSKADLTDITTVVSFIRLLDPLQPIEIGGTKLPAYVFIDDAQEYSVTTAWSS